ncbi:Uracil-DNA glycosylase-like protein, partial [Tylopilus felleus]
DVCQHLHPLQDYLCPGLDVVFCGINPGRMSAETGHHFANPTNHFWRCLLRSGILKHVTLCIDFSLPERFNIGLTNLVDRPSTQACELSRAEMVTSVPAFLDKLARHRPRFVCFVGMVIWEIVRDSLARLLRQGTVKRKQRAKNKEKNQMGLQTYKLVYGNSIAGLPEETLLFVVPCTSGRVVQYQLTDKIALFTELQTLVKTPSSEIDTSRMECV